MTLEREVLTAHGAPATVGPYSHAVRAGSLLFCSGQIPLDPDTGELVGAAAAEQARRCLENLAVVCDADQVIYAGMDKANGNAITYTSGALENPVMSKFVTDVLEGTRWAFEVRGSKYDISEPTE